MGNFGAFCVSERAKLSAVLMLVTCVSSSCEREQVSPVYDSRGTIRRLDYDTDHVLQIDMRVYVVDGRTVRIEADGNRDGVIDRWEYYGPDGELDRIGTASQSDGIEDTWVAQTGSDMRVDVATRRDGVADRHEFHSNGLLVRAEQDSNRDGRIDEWQHFTNGQLRELLLDTSMASGRPNQRLIYRADGSLEHVDSEVPSSR
jgi:hypothetical protein